MWTLEGDKHTHRHTLTHTHTALHFRLTLSLAIYSESTLGGIHECVLYHSQHAQPAPQRAVRVLFSIPLLGSLLLWAVRDPLPWTLCCPPVSSIFLVHTKPPCPLILIVLSLPVLGLPIESSAISLHLFPVYSTGWVVRRMWVKDSKSPVCAQAQSVWPSDFSNCQGQLPPRNTLECDYTQSLLSALSHISKDPLA